MKLSYINAVIMVDNYLPVFDMQEQMDTLPKKNVEGQLEIICRDITERKERTVTITPEIEANMALFEAPGEAGDLRSKLFGQRMAFTSKVCYSIF